MNHQAHLTPCSKCPLRRTNELNVPILEDFINECILMSSNHFYIIEQIIPKAERDRYYFMHAQAELLLSILGRLKMDGQQIP